MAASQSFRLEAISGSRFSSTDIKPACASLVGQLHLLFLHYHFASTLSFSWIIICFQIFIQHKTLLWGNLRKIKWWHSIQQWGARVQLVPTLPKAPQGRRSDSKHIDQVPKCSLNKKCPPIGPGIWIRGLPLADLFGSIDGMALLKEVCNWESTLRVKSLAIYSSFFLLCTWHPRCVLSAPCSCCHV